MPKYHKSQWDSEACYGKETMEESQRQFRNMTFLNHFKIQQPLCELVSLMQSTE